LDKRYRRYLRPTSHAWRADEVTCWTFSSQLNQMQPQRSNSSTKSSMLATAQHPESSMPISIKRIPRHLLRCRRMLPQSVELRQNKDLNNIIEQDHRFLQRLIKPGLGFKSFTTARRTIKG